MRSGLARSDISFSPSTVSSMLSRSALRGWSRLAWDVTEGVFSRSVTKAERTLPATFSVSAIFISAPGVRVAPFRAIST